MFDGPQSHSSNDHDDGHNACRHNGQHDRAIECGRVMKAVSPADFNPRSPLVITATLGPLHKSRNERHPFCITGQTARDCAESHRNDTYQYSSHFIPPRLVLWLRRVSADKAYSCANNPDCTGGRLLHQFPAASSARTLRLSHRGTR